MSQSGSRNNNTRVSPRLLERSSSPVEITIDYKIGILRKLLDRSSSESVKRFGLTLSDWRILTHIHAVKSVTASELCDCLLIDKAEVSRAVASLIERKLLTTRDNPKNKKSKILSLTKKGNNIFQKILPVRLDFDEDLSSYLSKEEHSLLLDMLDKLIKGIVTTLTGINE